jgi:hypothetical protein
MALKRIPDVFSLTNPIYDENEWLWEMNERRMRGEIDVLSELRPFDWETLPDTADGLPKLSEMALDDVTRYLKSSANSRPGDHYLFRQMMATYLNFPDMFATTMIGHLMSRRPNPGADLDFGGLGKITRRRGKEPTDAELVYFNADGIGNEGSQWDNYWGGVTRRVMATGHRWVFAEAPTKSTRDRSKMARLNLRPYLTDFSPLSGPQWVFEDGQLQELTLMVPSRRLKINGETLEGNEGSEDYLIMTRAGFTGFGNFFADGGYWYVDQDGILIKHDPWRRTNGEIPVFPMYYQRDYPTRCSVRRSHFHLDIWRRYRDEGPTDYTYRQAMSRSAITELGNAAISYMNISSAADFDAWDAAASVQFLRGVDSPGYNLAMEKMKDGSRWIPLPTNMESESPQVPIVQDASMGAVAATVFDMALKRKLDEVARLAATQATQAPDSSGLSKSAGFGEAKVPRLALLASELESAQNAALRLLELRFGVKEPSAQVVWTRKFNLIELSDDIEAFFNLEMLAGIHDQELDAQALVLAARDKGLLIDDAAATAALARYKGAVRDALLAPPPATAIPSGTRKKSKQGLKGAEPAAKKILEGGNSGQ